MSIAELKDDLSTLYKNYERLGKPIRVLFFVKGGYTVNFGIGAGAGILFFLSDNIRIGAGVDWNSNFKDINLFTIDLIFGWSF